MGLPGSEVNGDSALLSSPVVGLREEAEEMGGERGVVVDCEGGGVGDVHGEEPAEEDRRSGRF